MGTNPIQKTRVLAISREYPPALSGVATFMHGIIKRIKLFDFLIICKNEKGRLKTPNVFEIEPPKIISRCRYTSAAYFCMMSILNSITASFDIIIGNALIGSTCGVPIKILKRKPLISIVHDIDYIKPDVKEFSGINKFFRFIAQKLIFLFSDEIVVPSKKVKNDIIRYHNTNPDKISIIPSGIEIKSGKYRKLRKKGHVILFLGLLLKKKGVEYLITAFKDVNKEIKNSELWIVGLPIFEDYYRYLRSLVTTFSLDKKVKFIDATPNINPFFYSCDIFVNPSYHSEGLGIPCIEASSMGRPVVATKIFEQTGVVINNKTGIIVPPKNSKKLAKALIKLLKNKKFREKLGKNGKIFSKDFAWEISAKKFEDLCTSLVR